MYRFMKKNQRRLMAFFGVFLMIAFLATMGPSNRGQDGSRKDRVVATIDGQSVYANEIAAAKTDWDILKKTGSNSVYAASRGSASSAALQLGRDAVSEITAHPEMFCLLQKEAIKMGAVVNEDSLNTAMQNDIVVPPGASREQLEEIRSAVAKLLLVRTAFDRALDTVKISRPLAVRRMAQFAQDMKVTLVEFPVAQAADSAAAPTEQELKDQFNRYANFEPETVIPRDNPFGFGYKRPDRVKIQYLQVSHDDLRKVVRARQSDQEWEVAARRLYNKNQDKFQTATTKPTTRPFSEVKEDAIDRAMEPEVLKLMAEVQGKISSLLSTEWSKYQRATAAAGATSQPAGSVPVSSLGAAYPTFEFLHAVAAEVQKQTGVLPAITDVTEYKSRLDLSRVAGIGKSGAMLSIGSAEFGPYAIALAEPIALKQFKDTPDVLKLYQPSQWLSDESRNLYIFRITDARSAERPADYKEVEAKVREDFKKYTAYKSARAAGEELLDASKNQSLADAAKAAKKQSFTIDYFRAGTKELSGYTLDKDSTNVFIVECFRLISDPIRLNHAKPMGVIDLPGANKCVAVEVIDLRSDWPADLQPVMEAGLRHSIVRDFQTNMLNEWFRWDNVIARLRYKSGDASQIEG